MARSSQSEPVEKFRFKVTFFTLKPNKLQQNPFKNHLSDKNAIGAGFTEVVPPKANVNVIQYRENNQMNRTTKQPGLSSYEPVVLRKGVTTDKGLYDWYKEVHNDVFDLNSGNKILADANFVPVHDPRFRREMIISSIDREGKGVKHWLCINCFPTSYKGGDSLNASSEEKLVEEMTITYEAFIELQGEDLNAAIQDVIKESNDAVAEALEAAAIGAATGAISGVLF